MTKLQSIKRENGTFVFSVNIPLAMIENLKWGKGDNLIIEEIPDGLIIKRESVAEVVEDGQH